MKIRKNALLLIFAATLITALLPLSVANARHETWHNPACKDNSGALLKKMDSTPFDNGIYPPSSPFKTDGSPNIGLLDLNFDSSKAKEVAKVTGGAILCGTDEVQLLFYKEATLTYSNPSLGALVNCARPLGSDGKLPKFCNGQNIKEGAYVGSGISDVWCEDTNCDREHKNQKDNSSASTFVDYDTTGPGNGTGRLGDAAKNHCKDVGSGPKKIYVVGCFESRSSLDGIDCGSDIIVTKQGSKPYQMKTYQPTCETHGISKVPIGPTFIDTIRNFQLCAYANPSGATICGTNSPTTDCSDGTTAKPCWLNKNGKGHYKYKLSTVMVKIQYLKKGSKEKWKEIIQKDSPIANIEGDWK